MRRILYFLASLGTSNVHIGIRDYLFSGNDMEFLSSWLLLCGNSPFPGVKGLHQLSVKLGRPIELFTWDRDMYGTTDEAGYSETGIIIRPTDSEEVITSLKERLESNRGRFVTFSPDGLEVLHPIAD